MDRYYLDVAVDIPAVGDRRFTYSCPGSVKIPCGAKVHVLFGRSYTDAYVVGRSSQPKSFEVKDISGVYDPRFLPPQDLLDLCRELASYYCAPLASVWSCLWPPSVSKRKISQKINGYPERLRNGHGYVRKNYDHKLIIGTRQFRWEQYLQAISAALEKGQSVIVLVPEISQIHEGAEKLKSNISVPVGIIHSQLPGPVRRKEWLDMLEGKYQVVLGTRSAVFAPMDKLGLIIVDREENESYKAEDLPAYHGPAVAEFRAAQTGAVLMRGALSPSVTTHYRFRFNRDKVMRQNESLGNASYNVVDMRRLGPKNTVFSPPVIRTLKELFDKGRQAVLVLNRRGDSGSVICKDCGNTVYCPRCSVPLAYHTRGAALKCHTCGYTGKVPEVCPVCQGYRWRMSGLGIERAESDFSKFFPEVALFRLDTDILKEKEAGELLYSFSSTEPSCLLATKAVLSCHPLPQVDAVCVLYCDSMLNLPDFSAAEKTYNMLTGLKEMIDVGEGSNFIIQTYNPEHHAIKGVYDPDVYYFTELEQRRALGYPPFGHLFTIGISGKNRDKVNKVAAEMANKLQSGFPSLQVLGPGLDPKWRVRGMYQYRIAIKGKDRGLISRGYNKVRNEMGSGSQVRITLHTEDGVVNTGEGVITVGDFRDQVF